MPSNLLQADVGFPQFKEDQKPDEKITQVVNYLYMLLEQLRYSFGNIGLENFSDGGLKELAGVITEPINIRLADDEGRINDTMILAEGLYSRLYDESTGDITLLNATAQGLTGRISNAEGELTTLTATAQGLMSRMSDAEGNITTLTATANGLYTDIHGANGAFAQITANANAIATKVSGEDVSSAITQFASGLGFSVESSGMSSTIQLTKDGTAIGASGTITLTAPTIDLSGYVQFNDLSGTGGTTSINGENIKTGTITTARIKLSGLMSVYQSSESTDVGGFLGYASGSYGTGGIGMSSADGASYVAAINASTTAGATGGGAKMHGGPSSDYTKYSQVVANGGGVCLRYHYSNSSGDDSALYMNVIRGTGFSFHPGTNKGVHLGGPSHQFATLYCDTVRASGNMYINGARVLTEGDL